MRMTEMTSRERVRTALAHQEPDRVPTALGGGPLTFVYGPYVDGGPDGDFDDLTVEMVGPSFDAWHHERATADALLVSADLDAPSAGNTRSVRWNIVKLLQEYARHNGHADLIRQSVDGAVGE